MLPNCSTQADQTAMVDKGKPPTTIVFVYGESHIYAYIYIYQTIPLPPGRIQILPCHVVAPIAQVLGCEEQPSWRRSIAMKVPRKVWVMDAPNLILLALEIFWGTVSLPG